MNSSDMKKLFWQVFNCDGEDNLHKIVTSNEYFVNADNWYPYGGKHRDDRSNFATFESQQPTSGAALVEKITNSIDALLLKRCKQEGIDPKSQDSPPTMEAATEQFFEIPKGEIGELQSGERAQMARDNIQIIATGGRDAPDLMVYDYGEGQHPDNFKDTFLSIANDNKADIIFVQGKYNMGSTGAVVFCGEYRYQLIASKMDQKVFSLQTKHTENLFGWTLVRRHILTKEETPRYIRTWYEYFAIDGEKIPQFSIDEMDIGLYSDKKFTTGSFVKLFSYEMPQGQKTAISFGLNREFNQLLYKPALPFWLYEKRDNYQTKGAKNGIAVYGNHVRINNPGREEDLLERTPIYEQIDNSEMGTVKIQVVVFQKGVKQQESDRAANFIGRGRSVVYILNGQTQGTEGKSFVTQDLKYNFLRNSMLIVIDCSDMKPQFLQDLFMANRSHLRERKQLMQLRSKIIGVLKGNETLRQLNNQRKDAILQGGDDSKEKELIENLLSKMPLDKSLIDLLKRGANLLNLPLKKDQISKVAKGPKNAPKNESKKPMGTKRFPSIFKINMKEDQSGKKIKSIPLGGKGIIKFETDVVEDYFYRPQEKGEFQVHILDGRGQNDSDNPNPAPSPKPNKVEDFFEVTQSGPSDGSIKLTLMPKEDLNVGDKMELNARLTSPDGDMESIFYVRIVDPQKQEKFKAEKKPENPELPQLIKITKTEEGEWKQDSGEIWNESEWDNDSIIHIIPAGEEKKVVDVIAINMDSHLLQRYLSRHQVKSEREIDHLKNQYISKIYLHGLFLYSILEKLQLQKNQQEKHISDDQSSEDFLAQIFKDYGHVLIYLDANANREIVNLLDDGE